VSALFIDVQRVPGEGETVLGSAVTEPVDGGKSTCHAVAAARLGSPVAFVSIVGSDDRGRWWQRFLDQEGVDIHNLVIREGATDVGVVLLPPSRAPAIVSVAALSRSLDRTVVQSVADLIRGASLLVCSLECPIEAVEAAFRIAREAGVTTVLNPAPADGVTRGLLALADVIVPNEHEAAFLLDRHGDAGDLAAALAEAWAPSVVVVTAGAMGAFVARAGEPVCHVPAPRVDVVDTTGAGDSFVGALASRLQAGDGMEEGVRFAVRVASWSVQRAGSIESYPTAAQLSAPALAVGS
jgi:ribokinase